MLMIVRGRSLTLAVRCWLIVLAACGAFGQGTQFEVASVKPAAPYSGPGMPYWEQGGPGTDDPGRITYTNISLKTLILKAYNVKNLQVSGPNWLDTERYDIAANVPPGASKEQIPTMLQNLLADRFRLTVHGEKKELPAYALVVGNKGPKLKRPQEEPPPSPSSAALPTMTIGKDGFPELPPEMRRKTEFFVKKNGQMRLTAGKMSMPELADWLTGQLTRSVADRTGLEGDYDVTLYFTSDGPVPPLEAPDHDDFPNVFGALQEQLGLKLESRKVPVDVLVVDSAEKTPTEN